MPQKQHFAAKKRKSSQKEIKQKRQIIHLAQIMNTFQHEEDQAEFKLFECLYEEI